MTSHSMDASALEAKTQSIGRELFSAARREHAHLSSLNSGTAQILNWCLSDPAVKSRVLRLIDVLPALQNPRDIARHVLGFFPSSDAQLPGVLRLGAQLARPGLFTQGALAAMVRRITEQVAQQFIAESQPEAATRAIASLAKREASCSVDILGEQVLTEPEANAYAASCRKLLDICAATYAQLPEKEMPPVCGPRANVSVKPSALTPRFDPISPIASIERASRRLLPLIERADEVGACINLDMEQYEMRDLTLQLAQRILLHPGRGAQAHLGVVVQAYLKDSEASTERLLEWLRSHERTLAIRLVKGAYWDAENALAKQNHWAPPVYANKAETDAAFERLTRQLLSACPLVTVAIASHNLRSIAHAMAAAETLGLSKEQLEFQLLYGMGDAIHAAIRSRGYPVRIYTPIGELIPGMAYLVRRILENTANESFLRQEFLNERQAEALLKAPSPPQEAAASEQTQAHEQLRYEEPLADFALNQTQARMDQALKQVASVLGQRYALLIGEEAIHTQQEIRACNPAHPGQLIGAVSQAGAEAVEKAMQTALSAQTVWAATPVKQRIASLRFAAGLIRERRFELAAWTVLEVGKTWREADVEIVEAVEYLEYYSLCMEQLIGGKPLPQLLGERNLYQYHPRGVAVVIAPWNFPAAILTGMAAAALVTGNAVIVKPAEESSVIAFHLVQILRDAGVPAGAIQLLSGLGFEAGAALVAHPKTAVVLFTGSKAVGLSIIETCGRVVAGQRAIKHVVAEMGGKNAIIVDADADCDAATAGIIKSAFGFAGQKCSAASRVIIHEAVYDRLLNRLIAATDRLVVGDPKEPTTDLGPLIGPSACERLRLAKASARQAGRVAYDYPQSRLPPEGHFVGPALVCDLLPTDRLATEELFGPLACLFRVKRFEEAIALANATDYALTGGVYTRSPEHITQAIELFDVGNLYINRPITGAMVGRQPFGGHKLSGLGTKAGGPDYLLQLMIPKTICINTARYGTPLE